MKISMDKKYRTRDGRDVRLLCVDGPSRQSIIGLVEGKDNPVSWSDEGRFYLHNETSVLDLIEYYEPDIRTIWVNVFAGDIRSYYSEYAARRNAYEGCIAIAQPVTFEVKK